MLSVVVVTFNDPVGLRRTIVSLAPLLKLGGDEIEVIVQHGGGSRADELDRENEQVRVFSEEDSGIYDAMNRGLRRTNGSWVWFLNGGDENLADWTSLRGALGEPTCIVGCAYVLQGDAKSQKRHCRPKWYIRHGLPTSHQAIFYPGQRARNRDYDLRFPMSSDYAYTAIMLRELPLRRSQLTVSRFHVDGVSDQYGERIGREAWQIQRDILGLSVPSRVGSAIAHYLARRLRLSFRGARVS